MLVSFCSFEIVEEEKTIIEFRLLYMYSILRISYWVFSVVL